MKYSAILLITFLSFNCSPKLAPDATWGNQRWVVVEMKGVPVQQSGGRRDAFISFESTEKKFSGNGGCNQINGNYTLTKNEIRFTDVAATKMSCSDIAFENTFLATLHTIDHYEIKSGDMLLKKKKETLLVLRPRQSSNYWTHSVSFAPGQRSMIAATQLRT